MVTPVPPTKFVKDIMTPSPFCVKEGTLIVEAIHKMRSHEPKVTSAIVVSKDLGHIRGIITGGELMDALAHTTSTGSLQSGVVEDHMLPFPPPVNQNDEISKVAQMMDRYGVDHLVVVDNYIPIGIVSYGDVLDWLDTQFGSGT